jgi:transposase
VIPTKSDQPRRAALTGRRIGAEQGGTGVGRLNQFRRVATRCEKRVCNYLAMVNLAALIWL